MGLAAAEHDFEAAAVYRDRLEAARALLERQRMSLAAMGALDVIAVAVEEADANAQVFQVRDGMVVARRSFYLRNPGSCGEDEVLEAFVVQYYGDDVAIPPQVVVPRTTSTVRRLADVLTRRRGAPVEVRVAERGEKRRISERAHRKALLALDQDRLKVERRQRRRSEGLTGLKQHLRMASLPTRIECFDISNLGPADTVASMVVFEDGLPKKEHYRHFKIRKAEQDDYASMREVLSRRVAQYRITRGMSRYARYYDESFSALPTLVVIDGGIGQLSVSLPILAELRGLGSTVVSLAKRIEEVFVPDWPLPLLLPHESPPLQLLQQVRDEAHRFAIEFHRRHRESRLTKSFLDDIPRIGEIRKQAILAHFGTPERVLSASREEIEAVPGLQPKVARDVYKHLREIDVSTLADTGSWPTEYNVS
jgi:excinuclease ABC subunit C